MYAGKLPFILPACEQGIWKSKKIFVIKDGGLLKEVPIKQIKRILLLFYIIWVDVNSRRVL